MRACHLRDAVAVIRYLMWLEDTLAGGRDGQEEVTEYTGALKLEALRRSMDGFVSLSFDTISSMGSNGAIIHYKPKEHDCAVINNQEVYLLDSGGQYLDGTTDITRTVHFGTPSDHERRCWTRVLQSHISIDTAIFPAEITTGMGGERGAGGGEGAPLFLLFWETLPTISTPPLPPPTTTTCGIYSLNLYLSGAQPCIYLYTRLQLGCSRPRSYVAWWA